jgi:hypothetical protein
MENAEAIAVVKWLGAITRDKTLAQQNVRVRIKNEDYSQTGTVIFENRNGILFGYDEDSSEVSFIPWAAIQDISINPYENINN